MVSKCKKVNQAINTVIKPENQYVFFMVDMAVKASCSTKSQVRKNKSHHILHVFDKVKEHKIER